MDTLFTETTIDIPYTWGEELFLVAFGDVHRDTPSCDYDRWRYFLDTCKALPQSNTYYIGMGDFNDFASAKEQKIIHNSGLHEQTVDMMDMVVQKANRRIAAEMSFMKGHMLGVLDGNHNWVFRNGVTASQDLAERMTAPYLGWLSHVTLKFDIKNSTGTKRGTSMLAYLVACHGKAGGKLAGTTINQVEDLKRIFPIADFYIMGHDHQRGAWPSSVLLPGEQGSSIKQKRQFLARSGSFKKAYTTGTTGYEIGRLLRPADLGAIMFSIKLHRDKTETDRMVLDIQARI